MNLQILTMQQCREARVLNWPVRGDPKVTILARPCTQLGRRRTRSQGHPERP